MIHKNGFTHIILLVIIVLVGIAGIEYYAYKNGQIKIPSKQTDNSSPTPEWKTYTNDFLGYAFNYPYSWEVHSIYPNDTYKDGSNQKINLNQTPNITLSDDNHYIKFSEENYQYKNKDFKANAEQWLTYYLSSTSELGDSNPKVISEGKYVVGGSSGIRYEISYQKENLEKPGTAVWIYLPLDEQHLLSIKYASENSDKSELNEYTKIISTFKFLDQESIRCLRDSDCPSGYQCGCNVDGPGGADCEIAAPPPTCIKI